MGLKVGSVLEKLGNDGGCIHHKKDYTRTLNEKEEIIYDQVIRNGDPIQSIVLLPKFRLFIISIPFLRRLTPTLDHFLNIL